MENISRKSVEVAELRYKVNLQLFAEDGEPYPELENDPDYKEDARGYSKMDAKLEKFTEERAPKAEVKTENEPVEEIKAVTEEVATPEKPKQDAETNKAFQEMRKQLEAEQAKAKKADELISAQFGDRGIHTVEQYDQWIREGEEEAELERLTNAGLTPEEIQKLKDYDRIVQETSQEQQTRHQQTIKSQWDEVFNTFPDIEKRDIQFNGTQVVFTGESVPEWLTPDMIARLESGYSPMDAYRNAHYETIMQKTLSSVKEAAAQDAMDKLNSKDHLAPNASTGGEVDHVEIDPQQMAIYRKMTGKSDAEIRKFHKKQLAGG